MPLPAALAGRLAKRGLLKKDQRGMLTSPSSDHHWLLYNSSPSSQHALLDHHPVSPFLAPRSLLISCFSTEPYQSLHHVFGMTYHLNSAPFLRLHRRHCQSQDIIFIRLLYPSPPGPSTQN